MWPGYKLRRPGWRSWAKRLWLMTLGSELRCSTAIMRSFTAPSPDLNAYLTALAVFDVVAIMVRLWWWDP